MINYDTPTQLFEPATKVDVTGIHLETAVLTVNLKWYDANDNLVKAGSLTISGGDLAEIANAPILSGYVGMELGTLFRKAIKTKVKDMLGITGTVS